MNPTLTNTLRFLDLYGVGIQAPASREFVIRDSRGYVVTDGWSFGTRLGRTVTEARETLRRIAEDRVSCRAVDAENARLRAKAKAEHAADNLAWAAPLPRVEWER
jgi:hypothetical protein